MDKILKKAHWNKFHPPARPKPPTEPKKIFPKSKEIASGLEVLCLKDVKLPEGFSYKDIEISASEGYSWGPKINVYIKYEEANPKYEEEYLKYNKDLVKYEKDVINFESDYIEYQAWKKQEEEALLKKQINEAKMFLKKHDKG